MLKKFKVTLISGAVDTVSAHDFFWKKNKICFIMNGSEKNEWMDEIVAAYNPNVVSTITLVK